MSETNALFGIETSLRGQFWAWREVDERLSLGFAQRFGLPDIIARILVSRGIDQETLADFLNPSLKALLPDPAHLVDMDRAIGRLITAITQKQSIWIFGDYDVDGGTSAAILIRYFRALGISASLYVPDRKAEGYGPNGPALGRIKAKGADLVVTVDCGTVSFSAFETAHSVGLDCIVIDHHAAEPGLPKVLALVNPNRLDDTSPHKHMAACGVTFLVCVALNRALREQGFFDGSREPDLLGLLDLVALGTVCDVVPLTGVNRAFVTQGLKVMAQRKNTGLTALADVAGLDEEPQAYHAGFILGPRINAGGRVGRSDLGARLLASDNQTEAMMLAKDLDDLNTERREIEAQVLDQALLQAENLVAESGSAGVIVVGAEGWHPGVIGIVASRLKERYNRPACVIAIDGPEGSGSGRSIPGVDLGAAIIAAHQSGLLLRGGGHPMAAGFAIKALDILAFQDFMNDRLGAAISDASASPTQFVDATAQPSGIDITLLESLAKIGPFGVGNPEPRFVLPRMRVGYVDRIGKDGSHLKLSLIGEGGDKIAAICFRAFETELGNAFLHHDGRRFHVLGRAKLNSWQGRTTVQFQIEDAAPL